MSEQYYSEFFKVRRICWFSPTRPFIHTTDGNFHVQGGRVGQRLDGNTEDVFVSRAG